MILHLYYSNTHTQFEISEGVTTYGQLQAIVLNYTRLSMKYFQALMYNYQVIGEHLNFNDYIDRSSSTQVLQLIVNYFPESPSRVMLGYKRWLNRQVSISQTHVSEQNLEIVRIYLDLLIENPLSNLMTVIDHYNTTQGSINPTRNVNYDFIFQNQETNNQQRRAPHGTGRTFTTTGTTTNSSPILSVVYNALFDQNNPNMFSTLQDVLETLAPSVSIVLFQTELNRFPVAPYSELDLDNLDGDTEECSICKEEYRDSDQTRTLSCNHFFHKDCVDRWLTTQSVHCPICRRDMRPSSVE